MQTAIRYVRIWRTQPPKQGGRPHMSAERGVRGAMNRKGHTQRERPYSSRESCFGGIREGVRQAFFRSDSLVEGA